MIRALKCFSIFLTIFCLRQFFVNLTHERIKSHQVEKWNLIIAHYASFQYFTRWDKKRSRTFSVWALVVVTYSFLDKCASFLLLMSPFIEHYKITKILQTPWLIKKPTVYCTFKHIEIWSLFHESCGLHFLSVYRRNNSNFSRILPTIRVCYYMP